MGSCVMPFNTVPRRTSEGWDCCERPPSPCAKTGATEAQKIKVMPSVNDERARQSARVPVDSAFIAEVAISEFAPPIMTCFGRVLLSTQDCWLALTQSYANEPRPWVARVRNPQTYLQHLTHSFCWPNGYCLSKNTFFRDAAGGMA
jgi:hypothetical protein